MLRWRALFHSSLTAAFDARVWHDQKELGTARVTLQLAAHEIDNPKVFGKPSTFFRLYRQSRILVRSNSCPAGALHTPRALHCHLTVESCKPNTTVWHTEWRQVTSCGKRSEQALCRPQMAASDSDRIRMCSPSQ